MMASATTKAMSAAYCVPGDTARIAKRLASQLTIMKPPKTTSQGTLSKALAIG